MIVGISIIGNIPEEEGPSFTQATITTMEVENDDKAKVVVTPFGLDDEALFRIVSIVRAGKQ